MTEAKRTPLYDLHVGLGARMAPFAGYMMPVQYSSILAEHRAVRERAGLFDVSHMGEFEFSGPGALALLQRLQTGDVARLQPGRALYSLMCYENGTVVDDAVVYCLDADRYLMVVNAGNIAGDWAWITGVAVAFADAQVVDVSAERGLLALQGPLAQSLLQPLTTIDLGSLGFFHCAAGPVAGVDALVARTGYTGEDGFEIMCSSDATAALWEALLQAGADRGLAPCGLGARDTLRFEARLPLYGHEIDAQVTPLEAGLGRFVKLDKGDFIGRDALVAQQEAGIRQKLVGFAMIDRGIPRPGYAIFHAGEAVGRVTSGTFAPTLQKNLGLGFVPVSLSEPGSEIAVEVRQKLLRARVVKTPFYRRPKPTGGA